MSVRELVRVKLKPMAPSSPTAREQMLASAGQLGAGTGNLLFAFVMVRLLPPGGYANLAAFLALYLLLHVFAGSLSAGSALSPAMAHSVRPRLWKIGFVIALALVVASEPVGAVTGLPAGLVLALALAAPATGVLAVERGRLYGSTDYRQLLMSVGAEPVVRLTIGIPLALVAGAHGAGTGVAIAGWAALALAAPESLGRRWGAVSRRMLRLPDGQLTRPIPDAVAGDGADAAKFPLVAARPAVIAFLLFAVVMNQDLLWANRLLDADEAGRFAVISTLGGLAAFASFTVALVLLGRSDRPEAFRTALAWSSALGGTAVLAVAAAPTLVLTIAFGSRYANLGSTAVLYLLAMALLGVARVLAARLCSAHGGRLAAWSVGGACVLQGVLIAIAPRSARAIAVATFVSTAMLTLVLAILVQPRLASASAIQASARERSTGRLYWRVAIAALVEGVAWLFAAALREASRSIETITSTAQAVGKTLPAWVRTLRTALARSRESASQLSADATVRATAALTFVGLFIRLGAGRSIWLDEAIAISQARMPFDEMLTALRFGDVHPPLHSAILWLTVRVIGSGELAVRLPSMVAGTLLIPLLYAMGRDLYGRRTGLVAAAFGTFAPFLVWYSQEARMYALFMLFGLTAVWAQIRILRTDRRGPWILYVVATALLLWTHYFGLLQVVMQQAVFAVGAWRRHREHRAGPFLRRWIAANFLVALAILPMLPLLRDQLLAYANRTTTLEDVPTRAGGELDPAQQQLSVYALIANLVWAVWGYHSDATMAKIVSLWPLGMLFMLFLLGRRRSWPSSVAVASLAGPMLALFAAGFIKRDFFEVRYFVVVAPLLILLGARAVTAGVRARALGAVAGALVCVSLVAGLIDQQTNGANPRIYDFRGALTQVSDIVGPTDVVVYAPVYLEPVIDYYAPGLRSEKLGQTLPDPPGRVLVLASFLDKKEVSGRVGGALGTLEGERRLERVLELPRVKVWIFA